MKLCVVCLVIGLVMTGTVAAATPKPYQWTTIEAGAALMRQAENFYVETTDLGYNMPRDLTAAKCRGTGRAVAHRFISFTCTATYQRGVADPVGNVRVLAKTRRAGGMCWTVPPAPIPSGCFAPGKRAEGSVGDAFRTMVQKVGTINHDFRCVAHGAGFFTCSWMTAEVVHRGIVVFRPMPTAKVLS